MRKLFFFLFIFLILIINSIHQSYPDEMDNILGGYLINRGVLPYTGFFTHHGPLSYYLASFITFFSGQSFVKFRLLSSVFYLLLIILTFFIFEKRIKKIAGNTLFLYSSILVLSATYFWGHMFLADPISGYLFIPAYGLLFLKIFKGEVLKKIDLGIISIFSSLSLINSPTYAYGVSILVFFTFLYYLFNRRERKKTLVLKETFNFCLIFAAPYLLFALFLLATKTFSDYYFQALIYNRNYYVYNYPKPFGSPSLNPFRYAVVIFNNFFNAYEVLLAAIKNVDFINPFNVTLALTNLLLWVTLFVKRKFFLMTLSLLLIIYVNVRSNPLNLRATDYQSSLYIMLTFFNAAFLFAFIKDEIKIVKDDISRIILKIITVTFIIFWFFSFIYIFAQFWQMAYLRYMGTMPLIYDRPEVAKIVNAVVDKKDYCWIGPFDFEEILYLNCKIPSRFHIIRPPFKAVESFKTEMVDDFIRNKPDIIVYRYKVFTPGREDQFFIDFLNNNYVTLKNVTGVKKYQFKNENTQNFSLTNGFLLNKEKQDELIKKLLQKGYIQEQ